MGKLFVIEGTDGSGKSTQVQMTWEALEKAGIPFKKLRFPRYQEDSSMLLRMYLRGDFGKHPSDVNAYAASTFYAVDRYASYMTDWREEYLSGKLIFSDRYTTSNAVHQASKLAADETVDFVNWLFDYEYRLLGLPKPSCVIFLDMPTELSLQLLQARQGEAGDIHELDHEYLAECRRRSLQICQMDGWKIVPCAENGQIRPPEAINRGILDILSKELGIVL